MMIFFVHMYMIVVFVFQAVDFTGPSASTIRGSNFKGLCMEHTTTTNHTVAHLTHMIWCALG